MATASSKLWGAIASDVSIHGLAYLGVLLTFVGVLGFLLFAFADVADDVQPYVELFIALIFFGWAWALHRQDAHHVAEGMSWIGKILLPLILFAGLVDGAPFPPNFTEGDLVAALTITALALAAVYAWFAVRYPASTVRFLVAPLIWLAAMTLGFVFKTDEALASDAITRLVSAQPAMGAAAWRPDHRFSAPTMNAAVVGLPVAYLLTVTLAGSEGWVHLAPLVVLGAATLVSAELLASWFNRTSLMPVLRPVLLAGVAAPLVPSWNTGWAGIAVVVAYLILFEWTSLTSAERAGCLSPSPLPLCAEQSAPHCPRASRGSRIMGSASHPPPLPGSRSASGRTGQKPRSSPTPLWRSPASHCSFPERDASRWCAPAPSERGERWRPSV